MTINVNDPQELTTAIEELYDKCNILEDERASLLNRIEELEQKLEGLNETSVSIPDNQS